MKTIDRIIHVIDDSPDTTARLHRPGIKLFNL